MFSQNKVVVIKSDLDIAAARTAARGMARSIGFGAVDLARIATAVSELARNALLYAGGGQVMFQEIARDGRRGIGIEISDEGPGIANPEQALQEGFSTSGAMGMGLPGARRLMDEFQITSIAGKGTTITCVKWCS
jgi:serine/threonine-protein kinase RsbT